MTAFLYVASWLYWHSYLEAFQIDATFVDLSLPQIIKPVGFWIATICTIWMLIGIDLLNWRGSDCIVIHYYVPLSGAIMIITGVAYFVSTKWGLLISAGSLLPAAIIIPLWGHRTCTVKMPVKLLQFTIPLVIALMISLNALLGVKDASRVKASWNRDRITLYTASGWTPPANARLIGHIGGKYFITTSMQASYGDSVIVVDDEDVIGVVLYAIPFKDVVADGSSAGTE